RRDDRSGACGAMRSVRRKAPDSERGAETVAGPPVPLTTTRAALLVEGSDRVFREMLRDLMTMASQPQELRAGLARQLGVSEPEYRVFLAVAQLQEAKGVSISAVARHLGVSGAFVTMIVQRLVRAGKVQK